jgi:hypothetical protein
MPSTAQASHIQVMPSSPIPTTGKLNLIREKKKENNFHFRCCK